MAPPLCNAQLGGAYLPLPPQAAAILRRDGQAHPGGGGGGGVAVAGKTLPDNLPLVGGFIAFTGLLALVYGYQDKRQCHKELAEQAIQLAGAIESLPVRQLTEDRVCAWERVRTTIDLREPPNLKTLVSKCEWEQAVADGREPCCTAWLAQSAAHAFSDSAARASKPCLP